MIRNVMSSIGKRATNLSEMPPANRQKFLISTRDNVEGRFIVKELGLTSASAVRSKHLFEDIFAALGGVFGGETTSYTKLLNETTHEAVQRMRAAAMSQGATAIVNTKFEVNTTMNRMVFGMHCSVTCYGTAVICKAQPPRQLNKHPSSSLKEK